MLILGLGLAILLAAAAPIATPRSVRGWGLVLLALAFITISWNAVRVAGGSQPGDLLLLAALGLGVAESLRRRELVGFPRLAALGAGLLGIAGMLSELLPASAAYLSRRYEFVNPYEQYGGHEIGASNLSQVTKFEIALVALPMAVLLLRPSARELRRLGDCFVVSAVLSCLVGISDTQGFTSVSPKLLGFTDITGRASGLTLQPNHLAASVVLSLPLVMHWFLRPERRLFALPVITVLLVGIYATGSRGGVVVALLVCLSCFAAFPQFRRRAWLLLAVLPVALAARVPSLVVEAMQNRVGAQASDNQRSLLRQQGIADFLTHPLYGTGYQNITAAHEVHIQLLAAGGVLAFVGYFLYLGAVGRALRPVVRSDTFAAALAVVLGSVFAMHFVENQLTDRYLFVPFALAFALLQAHRSTPSEAARPDTSRDARAEPVDRRVPAVEALVVAPPARPTPDASPPATRIPFGLHIAHQKELS